MLHAKLKILLDSVLAASGGGRGGDRPGAAGGESKPKVVAAPQGPPGLFNPGDWACGSCGNTNWER